MDGFKLNVEQFGWSTSGSGHVGNHVTVDGFICGGGAVINNRKRGQLLIFELIIWGPHGVGPPLMKNLDAPPVIYPCKKRCAALLVPI